MSVFGRRSPQIIGRLQIVQPKGDLFLLPSVVALVAMNPKSLRNPCLHGFPGFGTSRTPPRSIRALLKTVVEIAEQLRTTIIKAIAKVMQQRMMADFIVEVLDC